MSRFYAVRHRVKTDHFVGIDNRWRYFNEAKLHMFKDPGMIPAFSASLRPELELVEVWVSPVRDGLN
jgi:hypothetical protein